MVTPAGPHVRIDGDLDVDAVVGWRQKVVDQLSEREPTPGAATGAPPSVTVDLSPVERFDLCGLQFVFSLLRAGPAVAVECGDNGRRFRNMADFCGLPWDAVAPASPIEGES